MSNKKNANPAKVKKPESPKTPTDAQGLRDLIETKEKKLGTLSSWQPAYDVVNGEILELQKALELADLRELPAPAQVTTQFQERDIALSTIVDTGNHREDEDQAAIERLANSLKTQGLQQRIGVREMGDGRFERIFGSRRTAAAKLAGWTEIPAKVYARDLTAAQVEILRSIENLGRKQLTPVEIAMAIARTIDACDHTLRAPDDLADKRPKRARGEEDSRYQMRLQAWEAGLRQAQDAALSLQKAIDAASGMEAYVGQQYSRPAKWVKDHAYVSRIGGQARALLMAGRLDVAQARELAKLGDKLLADQIADEAARDEQGLGGEDVQYVRRRVNESLRPLGRQPWKLDIAFGHNERGCTGQACMTCPFNTKTEPDLYGGSITDEPDAGFCTNEACFQAKTVIIEKRLMQITKDAKPVVRKQGAATETTLAPILMRNSIVKPSSAVRRVQKDLADLLKPKDAGAQAGSGSNRGGTTTKETPENIAQQKLGEAMWKWIRQVKEAVKVKADEDSTGVRMLALIAMEHLEFQQLGRWPRKPATQEDINALTTLATGDIGAIVKLLRESDIWAERSIDFRVDEPEPVEAFMKAWGIEIPKPKLEQFLPKPPAAWMKAFKSALVAAGCTLVTVEAQLDDGAVRKLHAQDLSPVDAATQYAKEHPSANDPPKPQTAAREDLCDILHGGKPPKIPTAEEAARLTAGDRVRLVKKKSKVGTVASVETNGLRINWDNEDATVTVPFETHVQRIHPAAHVALPATKDGMVEGEGVTDGGREARDAADFDEDTPIFDPEEHNIDVERLEEIDCSALLKNAGAETFSDVPEITPYHFDHKEWACIGLVTVRGRECWKLVPLLNTAAKQAPFSYRGRETAERASAGDFDGATVKVGRNWRILVDAPETVGMAKAIFVENAAVAAG